MLVLTRKLGEKIYIGDAIVIAFLGTHEGQIRLGIEAPQNIQVLRDNAVKRTKNEHSAKG